MKNSLLTALLLVLMAVVITSCYATRKTGCPENPTANHKFRS